METCDDISLDSVRMEAQLVETYSYDLSVESKPMLTKLNVRWCNVTPSLHFNDKVLFII